MLRSNRKTATKIAASVVLVGAAASVAGLGTFGSFTDSTSASENVSTGKVDISSANGAQGFTMAASNLVPGDTVQRTIVLTRSSDTEKFGTVSLTTTADTNNLLTSDATNGLQLKLEQCDAAWVQGQSNTLTCPGNTVTVLAQRAVLGSSVDLGPATNALNAAGAVSNLRATLTLPSTAGNTFQGLTNKVNFTFDATQRAAESR
jgi:predicted ribosomally synthesized peptide with SipW-like signal peptide